MPYFKCTFVNEQGQYQDKVLFGESKGLIWETNAAGDQKLIAVHRMLFKDFSFFRLFRKKIGYSEFLLFNQQLITLLKSGMPFLRALEIIIKNMKSGPFQDILNRIADDIRNGTQISSAFTHPHIPYQRIYQASLLAGEKSGHLETVLEKFNIYLMKITTLRRKTVSSLTYPVILLTFMFSMVFVIMVFVIPKFTEFYADFDATLPPITLFFISFSKSLARNILPVGLVLAAVYSGIKLLERYGHDVVVMDRLKLKIPVIGKIILENAMAVFTRTLSILISGGIPVPESTAIAVETFSNRHLFISIRHIPELIRSGNMASQTLKDIEWVPPILVEMIGVGETSGNLTQVLDESANFFEQGIDIKINSLISLIEPVIIIFLGVVIAFMLLSVYLPLFSSIRVIG